MQKGAAHRGLLGEAVCEAARLPCLSAHAVESPLFRKLVAAHSQPWALLGQCSSTGQFVLVRPAAPRASLAALWAALRASGVFWGREAGGMRCQLR